MKKTLKKYVSPIDIALAKFDETHPLSDSQISEIKKYEQVYYLRDHKRPLPVQSKEDIWMISKIAYCKILYQISHIINS